MEKYEFEERTVTVELGKIINSQQALSDLVRQKLPIKTSYWLSRNSKLLAKEVETLDALRSNLLEEHGEKDADGKFVILEGGANQIVLKPSMREEFWKQFNDLLSCKVEVKLKIVKLEQLGNIEIAPLDLTVLDYMIEE